MSDYPLLVLSQAQKTTENMTEFPLNVPQKFSKIVEDLKIQITEINNIVTSKPSPKT
jgi:hypothetical protein